MDDFVTRSASHLIVCVFVYVCIRAYEWIYVRTKLKPKHVNVLTREYW